MTEVTTRQIIRNIYNTQELECTADTAMLPTAVTTAMTDSYLEIQITPTLSSTLTVTRLIDSTTTESLLNSGNALVAGAAYQFTIRAKRGETYDLKYGATDTIKELYLTELL